MLSSTRPSKLHSSTEVPPPVRCSVRSQGASTTLAPAQHQVKQGFFQCYSAFMENVACVRHAFCTADVCLDHSYTLSDASVHQMPGSTANAPAAG